MSLNRTLPAVSVVPTWLRCSPALLVVLLAGCGGDLVFPKAGGPSAIRVVSGSGQSGQVGELLSLPLVVEVTDGDGGPVQGATVVFQLTSAGDGGAITPDTVPTGTDGRAQAALLLGDKVGVQTGEARVVVDTGMAPVVPFSATATAGPGNPPSPENHPPHADFHSDCQDLACHFTDASDDNDGSVTGYSWQFGDGGNSDQRDPSHQYAAAGTYIVSLTVTDNSGATDQTIRQIEVSGPSQSNQPPRADFDVHCHDEDCSFTDKSRDEDGTVTSWFWQFGDGFVSVEQNPEHSYDDKGHHQVTLTVTDNNGASNSKSHDVNVKD